MSKTSSKIAAGGYRRLPHAGSMLRVLVLIFGLSLLAACAMRASSTDAPANRPETKIIELRSSIVMQALLQVLQQRGFVVAQEKMLPRGVQTEWLQDGSYRSMVIVGLKPVGKFHSELTVQLRVEKRTFWSKSWEPFEEIERTAYADFLNAVLIESYRTLYDGR